MRVARPGTSLPPVWGNASEIVAQSDILFRESIRPAATRPAMVVADFTVTCWPRMARRANSKPLNAPGTRNAGLALTDGPKTLSLARCSAMISGRAFKSNRSRRRFRNPVDDLMLVADASALIDSEACAASAAGWTEKGFFLGSRIQAYIQTAPDQAWSLAEYKQDFCRMRIHDTWHPAFC
jgi:hypothetical protein